MNCLIVGFGEIGQGVYEAFRDYHDLQWYDVVRGGCMTRKEYDLLLICIPYTEYFTTFVTEYQIMYNPKATLIFSTVAIGTTSKLKNAVHCPVEGKHPNLGESIRKFDRYVGGFNQYAIQFFEEADIKTINVYDKPETTELLKLQSTTNYGINIEYARFVKELCDKYGVDYSAVKEFNKSYNRLYDRTQYKRYILDPPQGKIGGHCILSNAKLLEESTYHKFLEILEENNGEE